MTAGNQRSAIPLTTRLGTYAFPPLGLFLLWRDRQLGLARKIFSSVGILLYTIVYVAAVIGLLMLVSPLRLEWQGGFPPVLTFHRTEPNYDALESDRASKAALKNSRVSSSAQSSYWNGFRGPKRNGIYEEQPISTHWPAAGLSPLWKQPCGAGYASFAIAEGLAFTIEQRREEEFIVAYDVQTGHEAWSQNYNAHFDEPLGGEGPRATPAYDGGRLYSVGGLGNLYCLEAATGKVFWQKNLLSEYQAALLTYGMASSPLIVGDLVIFCPGGTPGKSVVACNKLTGETVWQALDDDAAYSSPMLVELAGEEQLLVATEKRVVGLSVSAGELRWSFPWVVNQGNRNIAQPVLLGTNRFMLSAGYGTGCVAVEVNKSGSQYSAREVWRNKHLKNKFTSSVFYDGFIYGLDEDILTCLDATTGDRRWKDGRYGYGQLLLASGHQLALVKANPEEHQELVRFQAIKGKTWNHPALSEGKLLVRNMVEMACFDLSIPK